MQINIVKLQLVCRMTADRMLNVGFTHWCENEHRNM